MTTISLTSSANGGPIPSNIATLEQLHAWSGHVLYKMYGAQSHQEVSNGLQVPLITINTGRSGDGNIVRVIRTALFLDPDYLAMPVKDWIKVVNYPFNSNVIAEGYKTN